MRHFLALHINISIFPPSISRALSLSLSFSLSLSLTACICSSLSLSVTILHAAQLSVNSPAWHRAPNQRSPSFCFEGAAVCLEASHQSIPSTNGAQGRQYHTQGSRATSEYGLTPHDIKHTNHDMFLLRPQTKIRAVIAARTAPSSSCC